MGIPEVLSRLERKDSTRVRPVLLSQGDEPTDPDVPIGPNSEPDPAAASDPPSDPIHKPELTPRNEAPPGKGIQVECTNIPQIYEQAVAINTEKPHYISSVCHTYFDDSLLRASETFIRGVPTRFNAISRIGYETRLAIADQRKGQPDLGYYDENKVRKVAAILKERGIEAVLNLQGATPTGNQLIINMGEQSVVVDFGWSSLGAAIDFAKQRHETGGSQDTSTDYFFSNLLKKNLANEEIKITLLDKDSVHQEYGRKYPTRGSLEKFTEQTKAYAKVYQEFLNALYEEANEVPGINRVDFGGRLPRNDPPPQKQAPEWMPGFSVIEPRLPRLKPETTVVNEGDENTDLVHFSDIAGQDEAVAEAKQFVELINNRERYRMRGVKPQKGLLLYGPSGTGKTLLARAISTEADAVFMTISSTDITNMWHGESERMLQAIFDDAVRRTRDGKPVILFIDELEAITPKREGAHEVTQKLIAIFLQNLDGMKANPNVFIIGATNLPDSVDTAIARSGRFDRQIEMPLPDEKGRRAILELHMQKAQERSTGLDKLFADDLNMERLTKATDRMNGADLANLVNKVLITRTAKEINTGEPWTPVTIEEILYEVQFIGRRKNEKQLGFKQ